MTRGAFATTALLLALTACSGGGTEASNDDSAARSTGESRKGEMGRPEEAYPQIVRRKPTTHGNLVRAPRLGSELPSRVEFPPKGEVASLVENPPGRAVMSIVNTGGEPGSTFNDLDGYTWYLYGLDGRWRVFDLGELGLPDSEWADWNVVGNLSPNGRYASLQVDSALLLVDMATGTIRTIEPSAGFKFKGGGKWTPDALIALGYSGKDAPGGVYVDPETGRQRQWDGPSIYRNLGLNYDWDGTPVLERWGSGDRVRGFSFYGRNGEVVRTLELPWVLRGRVTALFGEHRIAFHRQAADGKRLQQEGALVITDREAAPEHILLAGDKKIDVTAVAWVDDETLLLETPTALIAWRPDDERFYRLTRLDKQPEQFYYSIATDLVRPKPTD